MPRVARKKSPDSIYHVMSKSISEVNLFKDDDDKEKYLEILKGYQDIFYFKVYAYCLMDNHCHFIIDVNGADISKIFHGVNYKYAMYFNSRYKRHGHLFQDRFKSITVNKDNYLVTLSGYIHANPLSIEEYSNKVEEYEFSSLGIYLGLREDKYNLMDETFLMSQFSNKEVDAKRLYLEFVKQCTDENIRAKIEFKNEGTEYAGCRTIIARDYSVEKIIEFLCKKLNATEADFRIKNCKKTVEKRAILVLFMRCFCNYTNKEICKVIGNICQSRISSLCMMGKDLIRNKDEYKGLVQEFAG